MNERLRELYRASKPKEALVSQDQYQSSDVLLGSEVQKFAELLILECARIARATPCPYEEDEVRQRLGHTWDMASLEAGHEIVKHFGVDNA